MPYRLQRQKGGALAVHHLAYAETMHPGAGPWAEATRLYVAGSALAALLSEPVREPVVLFDVGLGAAANALAALTCHAELQRRDPSVRPLRIVSFEAELGALRFAIEEAQALRYPLGHEGTLRALLDAGRVEVPGGVRWVLRQGDFTRLIREESERADVIFFDPFSPRANPEMWSLASLEALYACRSRTGPGRLLTYSTAFATRAALLLAGFFVGEGPGDGRGSTMAAAWFGDLERPLNAGWLARWRREREPWPLLTPPAAHRSLRERLLEHPQWLHFNERQGRHGDTEPDAGARRGANARRRQQAAAPRPAAPAARRKRPGRGRNA